MCADKPIKAFVIYRHPVFALGVRDFLSATRAIQIVGMEPEAAGVIEAARVQSPEVVILEEPLGEVVPLHAVLEIRSARRVVTMSLGHTVGSVYEARRFPVAQPSAMVAAIRGKPGGRRASSLEPDKEVMPGQMPA
jgi:DNA-binding NarL/FixJ family response regulator